VASPLKATKEAQMRRSKVVAAAQDGLDWLGDFADSWRRSLHAKLLLATFLGVVIGGTVAWWGFPPRAAASGCGSLVYNTDATNDSNTFNHYGTRVANPGMHIFDGGSVCERVSSIASAASDLTGDNAEIGWLNLANGKTNGCHFTGDGVHHVFWAYKISGGFSCHVAPSYTLVGGNDYSFSVRYDFSSPHCQFCWIFDSNGNVLDEPTLGFDNSTSVTNGERHDTSDGATSHFDGMQFRTINNTWSSWGNAACFSALSNDPNYNNQLLSVTDIQVTTQAPDCTP